MLFNLGGLEILAIALLTLIIFGPERLPVLFRQFGNAIRKLRDYYVVLAAQVRLELEPVEEEIREIRQVANELRQDLAEIAEAIDVRALLPNIEAELSKDDKPESKAEIKPEAPAAPNVMPPDTEASVVAPVDEPATSSGLLAPETTIDSVLANFTQPEAANQVQTEMIETNTIATAEVLPTVLPVKLDPDSPWVTFEVPKPVKLDTDNPWAS
ncbi:MAG: twin-arginine translocase TatA/TatE family subunit [Chloroflexi bacterium]|jgi:sec-independent protein translocase protein TatB|nr:twin-arginine translocase TatA/TatE family subunit [Chloroflexota bacterium]